MSVMKLNDEEFLYLSELFLQSEFAMNENLGRSELYNIFRNLNVLGLCERYNDLFKSSWENDKKFDYIYQQYNTDGIPMNDTKTSNEIITNLINSNRVISPYNDGDISPYPTFNSLHYNSFGQNKFLSAFYKELYTEEYFKLLDKHEANRTQKQNEFVERYKYNILRAEDKDEIQQKPSEYIKSGILYYIQLPYNHDKKWSKEDFINLANRFAKQKALLDIANDNKLMKNFLTSDIVESKIREYSNIAKEIAREVYIENFAKGEIQGTKFDIEKINNDYKAEIDKVLSEEFVRKEEYNDVRICKTPAIYGEIGLDTTKDMFMSREHIRYDNRIHGIEKEQFYNLPELLKEPAIIMKSQSHAKSIIVFLNDVDNNNVPIMASIYTDGQAKYHFEKIDSNFITSVYGKENFKNFINNALNDNRLLFTDQKVINELENKAGIEIFKEKNVLTKNDVMQQ